jgi:hypothetical protein
MRATVLIAILIDQARISSQQLVHELKRGYAAVKLRDPDVVKSLDRTLGVAHARALDIAKTLGVAHASSPVIWKGDILEYGKGKQLTSKQLEILSEYVSSTYQLLECLDVATVEDRAAILDQILTLPSQPLGADRKHVRMQRGEDRR